MPLTELQIARAKAIDKDIKLADGGSLFLLVKTSGSKYWRYSYRYGGIQNTLPLGVYPEVKGPQARAAMAEAKKLLAQGIDPALQRKINKLEVKNSQFNTFEAVAREYLSKQTKLDARHLGKKLRRIEQHVFPVIGNRPINDIKPIELNSLFTQLDSLGHKDVPKRVLSTCSQVFAYAVRTNRCPYNICENLKGTLKTHPTEHYPHINSEEIPNFLSKLNSISTSALNRIAIKLLMLTFVRIGELRQARWQDIKWDLEEWHLPANTTKMKRPHIVPLSPQAIKVLKELSALTGDNFTGLLFPSQNRQKNPGMSENTLGYVMHKMGYKGRMVPHGWRHTASTYLNASMKFNSDVIEAQLQHKNGNKIRATYNHADYMPERKILMQHWGSFIEAQQSIANSKVVIGKFGQAS